MMRVPSHSIRVALASLLVAAGFWSPAFVEPSSTGFGDWQMVHHNWEVGYVAATRFSEWALWNPFFCGGITAFGNPESPLFSPFYWLSFAFGTTIASKVSVVLHALAGLFGMYFVGRELLSLRAPAAWLAAIVWSCSGFFTWHVAGGHATFLPFFFAPLLLLAFRRSQGDRIYALGVALILTLTLLEGGTYPFPYFLLLLGLDAVCGLTAKTARPIALTLVLSLSLTALLGAIRLLPIRDALSRMPRLTASEDALSLREVLLMLTAREHEWRFPPHEFVWPEYGTFVGVGVLLLALVGLAIAIARKQAWLVIGLFVFGALMLGEGGPFYPWSLLHRLPVFDSLRVPSRFAVLFTFYLALCAGLALDALHASLERKTERIGKLAAVAPWLVCVALVTDLFIVNWPIVDRWDGAPIATDPPAEQLHLTSLRTFRYPYASLPQQNVAAYQCYGGAMNWQISPALRVDGSEVILEGGFAALKSMSRTVNTVQVELRAVLPVRMILNQNYDPDWTTSSGVTVEDRGRLAVDLPAGAHRLSLRFSPRTLPLALALSALGACISLTWLAASIRKRRARG